jgi:6-phosphogluconate dehydrogenase
MCLSDNLCRCTTNSSAKVGIVGAGSMGTDMSLLLSEHEVAVSLFEVSLENIKNGSEKFSSEADGKTNMQFFTGDYGPFLASLNPGLRFFLLSITHGNPVDQVLDALTPHLQEGDVILDGGNE